MTVRQKRKRAVPWSLLWGALIVLLTIVLVIAERKQVVQAMPYLVHAHYDVLIVTFLCEVVFFTLQAISSSILYSLYGTRSSIFLLTGVLFHATMINEVLPTSGVSGTASFVYWGERLRYGLRDSIAVNIWLTILSYVALTPMIAICARTLWLLPAVPKQIILGTLELAVLFIGLIFLAFWLWGRFVKQDIQKETAITSNEDMTNEPKIGYYVSQGWRATLARMRSISSQYTQAELSKEWNKVRSHPLQLSWATLLLMSIYAVRILMLYLCFQAVGHPLSLSVAAYVYSLTLLVSVVSLSPTTLGVVEVAMSTALGWFGVSLPIAIAGTILYRLSSFWFPIPVGLVCQWWLSRSANKQFDS